MKKRALYTELCYILALIILALGTALTEKADLGMSMIVAPAYLLHLKISEYLSFFTFGMAEYVFQAFLLLLLGLILGRFKLSFLFSFVTAVLYGFTLDGMMALVALIPPSGLVGRIAIFTAGILLGSIGVSLFFKTYLSPEAYELFVKVITKKLNTDIGKVKTVYDISSCALAVLLSFIFFGFPNLRGISWGTLVCALINGSIISFFSRLLDRRFEFKDALPWRNFFEK